MFYYYKQIIHINNKTSMSHQMKAVTQQKVVENGRTITKNVVKPFHQSQRKNYHLPTIQTIPLNDWPSNTTLASNTRIRTQIPRGSFPKGHCTHLTLRFDATMNGSSGSVTDIFHWFSKLEIRAGGSSELLATYYNDTMLFNYLLQVNKDQFTHSADTLAFDRKVLLGGRTDAMSSGQTKTFYLPLVNSIFSADLEWDKIDQDIILEFTVSSGSPVISGSGTITCNAFVVIESRDNHPLQKDAKHALGSDVVHSHTFLDCVRIDRFAQTLSANNQYLLPTDSVVGSSPFVLINTSPAGTNENTKFWSSQDYIGDSGLVNFLTPNGEGILGNSHIRADVLRQEVMTKNMKNNLMQEKKGYLVLPFTENWQGASAGVHNGCFQFSQQKNNIMLQPAASRVSQVMTITVGNSAVLTSGQWRIKIGNEYTPYFNYNDTVATVKAGLEALKISSSNGITYTLSAALSSSASPTLTIASGNYVIQDSEIIVESNAFTGSSVPTAISVATTTAATAGVSGQVDVTAYVFVYKNLYQNKSRLTAALDAY
jgi:hypothetical protein